MRPPVRPLMRPLVAAALAAALSAVPTSAVRGTSRADAATATRPPAASTSGRAHQTPPAQSVLLDPSSPAFIERAPDRSIVRLETSRGNVDIEVIRAWAPRGADRFVNLVRHGYYDDTRIFRIRVGRWVQFGVNGDPRIAQAWRHATFPDDPPRESNVRGAVAFAFAEPDGRTTQVFVNMGDNSPTLDAEPFVPFGRVISGMAHLDAANAEHGEGPGGIRAGGQDPFFEGGNRWLDAQFPRLDVIRRARVVDAGAVRASRRPPTRQARLTSGATARAPSR